MRLEAQIVEMLKRRFAELPEDEKQRLMPREDEVPVVYVSTAAELGSEAGESRFGRPRSPARPVRVILMCRCGLRNAVLSGFDYLLDLRY